MYFTHIFRVTLGGKTFDFAIASLNHQGKINVVQGLTTFKKLVDDVRSKLPWIPFRGKLLAMLQKVVRLSIVDTRNNEILEIV